MEAGMAWLILVVAALFEIGWAVGLKSLDGFSRPTPVILTIGAMGISIWLLSIAMRDLPLGTAYAVWTGLGAVGTATFGILFFGELASPARIASIGLIVLGIAGLKLASS
jgi:quaternary ammonium compound-resistance protein SugE